MPIAHFTPRWIGCATLYQFRDEQADAIARFPPSEHDGVRQSLETSFPRTSNPGISLGFLGSMPLELLHNVFLRLDLDSLFKLRQTNLRSRQAALCTKNCTLCGQFGVFMSLLTWTRCCYRCMQLGTEAKVLLCRSRPCLPGTYTLAELAQKSRRTLMSFHHALLACKPADSLQRPHAYLRHVWRYPHTSRRYNFMGACALPYYDAHGGTVEHGMSCAGCQRAFEQEFVGDNLERCERKADEKTFSQAGFLEHFRSCEHAQLLWESSGEGGHDPAQLLETSVEATKDKK
ncbi:hypothetical protein B0T24DRAFT_709869 [Lasiosphaeria ovina]|uniref:F-box domain-containing protein n=1 Tax=Lasiosphaeria ovina TaxID=92902 RepID=A0AAE0N2N6_9PEZI|nr:hypothetical protein B0T24DRAFT_709869 [Lasiosphaeria ovina]